MTGTFQSTLSAVTLRNQFSGGPSSKYSAGPHFHNSELLTSSGLSTFLELRSAGKLPDAKCAKNIWREGFFEHMAFAMR